MSGYTSFPKRKHERHNKSSHETRQKKLWNNLTLCVLKALIWDRDKSLLMARGKFQHKHTGSHVRANPALIINAEHDCRFVKVNSADPCPLQHRPGGRCCVCFFFHEGVVLHLDTSRRLPVRTGKVLRRFLLLQASLTDAVATTPFMWLPRNTLNRQCCTHWLAVITGASYCVSTLKVIQVSVGPNVALAAQT